MKTKLTGNKFQYNDTSIDSDEYDTKENLTYEEVRKNLSPLNKKEILLSGIDSSSRIDWKFVFEKKFKNLFENNKISINELELRINSLIKPLDNNFSISNKIFLKEKNRHNSKNKNKFVKSVIELYNKYNDDKLPNSKYQKYSKYKHDRIKKLNLAKSSTVFSSINSFKINEDFAENDNQRNSSKTTNILIPNHNFKKNCKPGEKFFKSSTVKTILEPKEDDYNCINFEKINEPVLIKGNIN